MGGHDELASGTDFAGKYTIEGTIGAGGMGVVYRALHRRIEQQVAIKMLLPSMLDNVAIVARFEREARAAGQLRSRHTVRVVDVGEDTTYGPYMVMEFLHGQDLGAEMEQRGQLPVAEAVEWLLQACSAMAEAHDRGIVHRDLKPANLFLAQESDDRVLKVLDFGISKLEDGPGSSVTNTSVTMGTPLYMSPEQVRSTKNVDIRSDIWSLGIILYELLSGKTPFEGAPAAVGAAIVSDDVPLLHTVRRDVSPSLSAVVQRALEKKRDDRYADARAFAAALQPWSTRAPTSLTRVRPSDPQITTASHAEERAPTIAMGVQAHTPVSAEMALSKPAPGRDGKPITEVEWTTGHSTPKKRTGLIVVLGAAAILLIGGIVAMTRGPAMTNGNGRPEPTPSASLTAVVPTANTAVVPTASTAAVVLAPLPSAVPTPSAIGETPRPAVAPTPRPAVSARPRPPPAPSPDNPIHL